MNCALHCPLLAKYATALLICLPQHNYPARTGNSPADPHQLPDPSRPRHDILDVPEDSEHFTTTCICWGQTDTTHWGSRANTSTLNIRATTWAIMASSLIPQATASPWSTSPCQELMAKECQWCRWARDLNLLPLRWPLQWDKPAPGSSDQTTIMWQPVPHTSEYVVSCSPITEINEKSFQVSKQCDIGNRSAVLCCAVNKKKKSNYSQLIAYINIYWWSPWIKKI